MSSGRDEVIGRRELAGPVASPPTALRELDGPDSCDMCGTPGLKTELVRDPFIYGAGDDGVELVVDIPVQTCSSCGPYTDDAAEDLREAVVRQHLASSRHRR